MLKNYLKIAFRNLTRNKTFSAINILSLAIGIASCIIIFLYVENELSYDKYNKNADRIYRISFHGFINGEDIKSAFTPTPLGPTLYRECPEVKAYTRFRNLGYPVLRYKDKAFSEEKFYSVDSTFFNVFTVPFIEGNQKTALTQPNTVVITKSMAKKYFGNENPMGKIINADHRLDYIVTGVIKDFPHNSHFRFDFLGSFTTYNNSRSQFWLDENCYTYILLKKGTDPSRFIKKVNEIAKKYIGPQVKSSAGISLEQFLAGGNKLKYFLQPLTSIHLYSHLKNEIAPNGDISYIYIFSAIAIALLLIASINFMNLATARSEKRAKEVGIRKTLGSSKLQLIGQFISESILISSIAVCFSLVFSEVFLPSFNHFSGKQIKLELFNNFYTIPLLIGFIIFTGILAGSYPAFFLSSFRPVKVLKKDSCKGTGKSVLRSGLVVFQFTVSISLFIGTFVIYKQLDYIQNKNLGFNKEHVLIINNTDGIGSQVQSFKQELLSNSNVLNVSNSSSIPGQGRLGISPYKIGGASTEEIRQLYGLYADFNFQKTYQIKMAEGRFFSKEHPSDTMAVVLNQAAVRAFNLKDPVGKNLLLFGKTIDKAINYKIIGVVKDFNYESLHQTIRPLVIHLFSKGNWGKYVSVRIAGGGYQNTISFLKNTWGKYAGNQAFNYNFFDQDWAHLYDSEQVTSKIASIFSILAIFIACLGLLGLAAFVTEQRRKEIGIRKVLGATVSEIVFLLSKEFIKWVLIANVIAWPIAYYLMKNWLSDFAYRINIGIGVFILAGVSAIAIALLTVSTYAIRTATANPVKSLRYE